jgi:competence protein ComFB
MESTLKIHNITEDLVISTIDKICDEIEASGQNQRICTCKQCRLDAACYVLNRTRPCYVLSNRGAARIERDSTSRQQENVDITVLVYRALEQVAHNRRPNFVHYTHEYVSKAVEHQAVYNIPVIIGRLLNGSDFGPLSDIDVKLEQDKKLVEMRDFNWQNPCHLIKSTEGTYTFWPEPVHAETAGAKTAFDFSLRVEAAGFEPLRSAFEIMVTSEPYSDIPFTMGRTFRLKDMYLFPEGEDER